MMPIAPLMIEHRLIERMVKIIKSKLQTDDINDFDANFVNTAIDFIRTYADKCHHGKEEDILFKQLEKKKLQPSHGKLLYELVREHAWARKKVAGVSKALERFYEGDKEAIDDMISGLRELVEFYPRHIEKEDKHFFLPVMDYFTSEERDNMLEECREFDRKFIHERYRMLLEELERN